MSRLRVLPLLVALSSLACGDTAHRPIPGGAPGPLRTAPSPAPALAPTPPADAAAKSPAASPLPVELDAEAAEGYAPLPTYRVRVRNLSARPIRNVVATAVYLDARGVAMKGENQGVAFGSPIKAIDPGATLETTFLSRVERAPSVRLVLRSVTFLEKGKDASPVTEEWTNPAHDAELAALGAKP